MRSPRAGAAGIGVALACALVLGGCTGSGSNQSSPRTRAATAPVTITYAHEQEFSSYNNVTAAQGAVRNSVVLNQVLSGFWHYGPQGTAAPDPQFGTFTKVGDKPLTVKYTVNPKAVWSDGVPIDCADFVLAWAAQSGKWPTGKKDPDTGEPLTAFRPAGEPGYEQAKMPRCNAGDRSFTLVYDTPFADWQTLFGNGQVLPAHIVEKQSGVTDLIAAIKTDDLPAITKLAAFWNTGWVFKPGTYETEIAPSAGPYQVASWDAGRSITLKPNPRWWGTPPRARTIVIRIIKPDQQADALRTGEIQVMDPQPTPELLSQVRKLGSAVTVTTADRFDWEHLDVNFTRMFKDAAIRQAFAKCVPRQTIVDNLITPLNPKATVQESRFLLPFQDGYDQLAATGGQAYDRVDIAGARKLLEGARKSGLTVRIGYQTPDQRRSQVVDLIRDSCGKAGFRIKDAGSPTFFGNELANSDYDVALYAWSGSARVSQNSSLYAIGGRYNFSTYDNAEVDGWLKQLNQELDPARQLDLRRKLDTQLWKDLATIPLFAYPGIVAVAGGVTGVQFNASQNELTWNAQDWSLTP